MYYEEATHLAGFISLEKDQLPGCTDGGNPGASGQKFSRSQLFTFIHDSFVVQLCNLLMNFLTTSSDLSSSILNWLSAIEPPCTGSVILQQSRKRARSAETLPPSNRRAKSLEVDISRGGTKVSSGYSVHYFLRYTYWENFHSMDYHHQRP